MTTQKTELKRSLGLPSAIAMVMGSMIGSGIFIVSADIARTVESPGLLIVAWLIAGFMTLIAALSYAELSAMMPHAGGQYVFLRESLGPLWGFLYGWTLFLVIQTGTIAAVAVAFAKFVGVWFPSISAKNTIFPVADFGSFHIALTTQNGLAILLIALLTLINVRGVKAGAWVQNIFTTAKVLALLGLIIFGFSFGRDPLAVHANFGQGFWTKMSWSALPALLIPLAIVQVGSLFSADAWNNVTFTAAEVRDPHRNLPLALLIGVGTVILLYVLSNFAYLSALPLTAIQMAPEDRVGTAVLEHAFPGSGARWMALAIAVSTFGCANGMVLAGSRVYFAMSEDGLFFQAIRRIHSRFGTPDRSLILQGVWACLLCISGSYGQLLDYIIFAVLLFYILTLVGLVVLRQKRPQAERPYRAWGYPVLPMIYIAMALFIEGVLLVYKPQYTWPGLIIVCTGFPVYWIWRATTKVDQRVSATG